MKLSPEIIILNAQLVSLNLTLNSDCKLISLLLCLHRLDAYEIFINSITFSPKYQSIIQIFFNNYERSLQIYDHTHKLEVSFHHNTNPLFIPSLDCCLLVLFLFLFVFLWDGLFSVLLITITIIVVLLIPTAALQLSLPAAEIIQGWG